MFEVMPFACQILRGTTGATGTCPGCDQDSNTIPPQLSAATSAKEPKPPKVMFLGRASRRANDEAGVDNDQGSPISEKSLDPN
jgi:hypothetical protein